MSFGVQIVNNSDIVLIDQDYATYAVYSSGTMAVSGSDGSGVWGSTYFYNITIPNIQGALVFIKPVTTTETGGFFVISGGEAGTVLKIGSYANPGNLKYIIVVPSSALPITNGYGFNIYKIDGTLAFSSLHEHLTLVNVTSVVMNTNATIIIPNSTKNRYICINAANITGHVNAMDEFGFAYNGNIYTEVYVTGNNSFTLSASDYLFFYSGFNSGSLTGGFIAMSDIRQFLILETSL